MGLRVWSRFRAQPEKLLMQQQRGGNYETKVTLDRASGRHSIRLTGAGDGEDGHHRVTIEITANSVAYVFEELCAIPWVQKMIKPEYLPHILAERKSRHE
jgi:hypothetical protein